MVLLGVLGLLHALSPDREALRDQLMREIDGLEARPGNDPIRQDRRMEELLGVEEYRLHARAQWLRLERLHGPVHQAARAEEAAGRVVPAFLARGENLDGLSASELRAMDDEARSLWDQHGSTRFGPALVECRKRLAGKAASTPVCTDLDHFRLQQEVEKDRLAGRYAAALARIAAAQSGHPHCDAFLVRLTQERGIVVDSGSEAAQKLLAQAGNERAKGRREAAAGMLERALPEFRGLPEEGRLRALLADLRRR